MSSYFEQIWNGTIGMFRAFKVRSPLLFFSICAGGVMFLMYRILENLVLLGTAATICFGLLTTALLAIVWSMRQLTEKTPENLYNLAEDVESIKKFLSSNKALRDVVGELLQEQTEKRSDKDMIRVLRQSSPHTDKSRISSEALFDKPGHKQEDL